MLLTTLVRVPATPSRAIAARYSPQGLEALKATGTNRRDDHARSRWKPHGCDAAAADRSVIRKPTLGCGGSGATRRSGLVRRPRSCPCGGFGSRRDFVAGSRGRPVAGSVLAMALYREHPRNVRSLILAGAYAGWAGSFSTDEVESRTRMVLESLVVLPRTGNAVNVEAPEEFDAAARAFLRRVPLTRLTRRRLR